MIDEINTNSTTQKNKKLLKSPLFWVAAIFILYMFVGFIVIPFIIRGQAIDFIKEEYNRDAKIETVSFNPFTFTLSIEGFLLNEKDRGVFLKWGDFYVNLNLFPLFSKDIDIEELQLLYPEIQIIKKREKFNFSDLITQEEDEADSLKEEFCWGILIRNLKIRKLNVLVQDKSVEPMAEVHIDSIDVLLTNIHPFTSDTTEFKVDFEIREGGKGFVSGIFTQIPMMTEFTFDMDSVAIIETQPYLSKFAYLRIDDGAINLKGTVKLIMPENENTVASYIGTIGLNDLNVFDTKKEEKFLAWDKLENRGVEIHSEPILLTIDSVLINGLFSRIAIAKDQTINILDAFEPVMKNMDTTTIEEKEKLDYKFDIGMINISNSEMYFSDFSLPINFAVRVHSLNGNIAGFSSGNPLGAVVALEGTVDEYGFAKIEGNLDPFNPLNYTNIAMNFHNIDLVKMSGYSAKFVGYKIEKGKLSLDLEYLIRKGMLTSTNQIFLNKLTLGDEVEGEEGIGLPIKLAIALLKDSDGNIDLDFEVEGDLNDPEISTGKLVWWAVKRTLTTIVTAPFRFLGNLLGLSNGGELEYVDFEVADTSLAPHQIEKLINITKALNERPGLSLGIYGAVDTVSDKYALQKIKFDSLFTAGLKKISGKENILAASADQELRRQVLESLYREAYSDSLLNIMISQHIKEINSGNDSIKISAKDIHDDQIIDMRDYFNSLINNIIKKQKVNNNKLMKLAAERAERISDFLINKQKLPVERILVKENEIYENEDDDWVKCRLELGAL
ncbi:hypothetical protein MNBD_IGNAVI01-2004 [hydrothermal vent metagenome]|uniref:DUF748 domain-containing protein n=1 Tax=hydrothermal vent metagenome TaxID=652676 RepID=A0A3B1BCM9_9ZZZZ